MTKVDRRMLDKDQVKALREAGFILSFRYSVSKFWDIYDIYAIG